MEYVNTALRRNIIPGNQYNKYFDKSECKVSYLGKGDTYHTLSKMKTWANKFSGQTKKLAMGEFAGKSLEQIAREVHQFLYWHLQYQMDGADQNLKSPACAWATRSQGIDCKGYSIFASSILQNLGIKHYFRKVKQPAFEPELWSHVYIIVPKNQKTLTVKSPGDYLVIDPTVANNMEVTYSQTKEELMSNVSLRHYGLAAPRGLLGCSCTAKPRQVTYSTGGNTRTETVPTLVKSGLRAALPKSEQQLFNEAYGKFKALLSTLAAKGVPPAVLQIAHNRLQESIRKGVEPTLRDLLSFDTGLGITGVELSILSQALQKQQGGGSTLTQAGGGIANTSSMLTTASSLITSIIPKDIFDKTFGAVFANGFNFKCWGASWNPTKAEKTFLEDAQAIETKFQQVLSTPLSGLEKAFNDYWVWFYGNRSTERDWLNTSAKDCTKDGLKILIGSYDGLAAKQKSVAFQAIEQAGHSITSAGTVTKTYPPESHTGRHALTFQVPQYKIKINSATTVASTSAPRSTTTSTRTPSGNLSTSYVDANGNLVIPNTAPQEAGFGWVAAGLIAAVAIGAYAMKDKPKN